jgi:hypothetical protein
MSDHSSVGQFQNIVANAFRKAGWRVRLHPTTKDFGADLIAERAGAAFVVGIKSASEGRRDRLIPLLSQGILETQAFARQFGGGAAPLAVVAARRIPLPVADQIIQFAHRHAPEVAIGLVDGEGYRKFAGPGLSVLDAKRSAGARTLQQNQPDLFSDLNQWMLKILVGRNIRPDLLSVPRDEIRNASHLAEAASVSSMSAFRFVNQLAKQGFLDEKCDHLRIVRLEELFEKWAANYSGLANDLPSRWIIKKDDKQFLSAVAKYASQSKSQPRCCLGLFAAADALGFGFVRGVPPYLYLENSDLSALRQLGLTLDGTNQGIDVNIRIPSKRETVFRAAVSREGMPVSDVIQVWLDTAANPARGREQADEIWRRILKPIFGKRA